MIKSMKLSIITKISSKSTSLRIVATHVGKLRTLNFFIIKLMHFQQFFQSAFNWKPTQRIYGALRVHIICNFNTG